MIIKTLALVLFAISVAQSASIERTKRQYGAPAQYAVEPALASVQAPVPSPLAPPVGVLAGGTGLMDLVLLSALYGGGGFGGRGSYGHGGHGHGGRYKKEAAELSADDSALTVDTDEATEARNKRQVPPLLGAGLLGTGLAGSLLGGVGVGGSPIIDLLLLNSIYGNDGPHRRSHYHH